MPDIRAETLASTWVFSQSARPAKFFRTVRQKTTRGAQNLAHLAHLVTQKFSPESTGVERVSKKIKSKNTFLPARPPEANKHNQHVIFCLFPPYYIYKRQQGVVAGTLTQAEPWMGQILRHLSFRSLPWKHIFKLTTEKHKALAENIQTSMHKLALLKLPKGAIKVSSCLISSPCEYSKILSKVRDVKKRKKKRSSVTFDAFSVYLPTSKSLTLQREIKPRFFVPGSLPSKIQQLVLPQP